MSLLDKALRAPRPLRRSRVEDRAERAELAVAVLRGEVSQTQAVRALGVKGVNSLPGTLWSSLRWAVEIGAVRIEWIGAPSEPSPQEEPRAEDPSARRPRAQRSPTAGKAPAGRGPKKPAGRVENKASCIRAAVAAISGNFTSTEILDRVEARWPQEGITMNHVCATLATMLQANEITALGKEERGTGRVMVYRAELPKEPGSRRRGTAS